MMITIAFCMMNTNKMAESNPISNKTKIQVVIMMTKMIYLMLNT